MLYDQAQLAVAYADAYQVIRVLVYLVIHIIPILLFYFTSCLLLIVPKQLFLHSFQISKDDEFGDVIRDILDYVSRDLSHQVRL